MLKRTNLEIIAHLESSKQRFATMTVLFHRVDDAACIAHTLGWKVVSVWHQIDLPIEGVMHTTLLLRQDPQ